MHILLARLVFFLSVLGRITGVVARSRHLRQTMLHLTFQAIEKINKPLLSLNQYETTLPTHLSVIWLLLPMPMRLPEHPAGLTLFVLIDALQWDKASYRQVLTYL